MFIAFAKGTISLLLLLLPGDNLDEDIAVMMRRGRRRGGEEGDEDIAVMMRRGRRRRRRYLGGGPRPFGGIGRASPTISFSQRGTTRLWRDCYGISHQPGDRSS